MSGQADIEVTGIAAGGAGVGRLPDGRAVFVQRTAPGDLAHVRVVAEKRRWARAELVRLERASELRREPPCPHFARGCGGCTLEHMRYEAQLAAKAELVAEALRRIGGIDLPRPEVVASPSEFRYRNRVAFTLVRYGGEVAAGFHQLERPGRVLDIDEACLLPEAPLAAAWGRLRAEWGPGANRLPSGQRVRLTLRASADGAVGLLVQGGYSAGRPTELLERTGLSAIWHQREGESPRLLAGEEAVREVWDDEELALSGAVFLQVNRGAAALLEEHVFALATRGGERRVVDAYCGVGLHARRLARAGAEVVGIELDEHAVEEARRATAPGARFEVGRVEDLLPPLLPAELVITNPPRAGMHARAVAALEAEPPQRMIYISCDPATLARDLDGLRAMRVRSVRCFDLFPQTSHVESVVELERADAQER